MACGAWFKNIKRPPLSRESRQCLYCRPLLYYHNIHNLDFYYDYIIIGLLMFLNHAPHAMGMPFYQI
jgi:hypothetical protein